MAFHIFPRDDKIIKKGEIKSENTKKNKKKTFKKHDDNFHTNKTEMNEMIDGHWCCYTILYKRKMFYVLCFMILCV